MIITGSIATITSDVEVSEDNRVHLYLNGTNAQGIVVHMNKDEAQRVSDLLGHAVQDIMLKEEGK